MANGRRRVASALVGLVAAGMISTAGVAAADGPLDLSGSGGDGGNSLGDLIGGVVDGLTGLLPGGGSTPSIPSLPSLGSPDTGTSSSPNTSSSTTTPAHGDTTNIIVVPPAYYGPGNRNYGYVAPRRSDLNCGDFADPADAQAVLLNDPSDPYNLDGDNDGRACEWGVGRDTRAYTGYPVGGIAAGDGSDSGPDFGQVMFLIIAGIGAGAGVVRGGQVVAARRETV
jgi:hypothetical protein